MRRMSDNYWTVAGDTTRVYSSARATYVPRSDTSYVAWLAANIAPTTSNSEAEVWEVLRKQCPAGLPLQEAKKLAELEIDAEAGITRSRYITSVPGQAETYLTKAEQARAFKAAGYVDITAYPFVKARADAYSETARVAADTILGRQAQWLALGGVIERERELGKRLVNAATDVSAVAAAKQTALNALKSI